MLLDLLAIWQVLSEPMVALASMLAELVALLSANSLVKLR
jgi:hypothetical protein